VGGGATGAENTGNGGQGGVNNRASSGYGGSGVVILRYPSAYKITIGAGLTGSTATVSSDKVTTITAGTGNVSWAYAPQEVEYLVIAGGGAGGIAGANSASSGGAAGGYRTSVVGATSGGNSSAEPTMQFFFGIPYGITVGAGGAGVPTGQTGAAVNGSQGSDSVISENTIPMITSLGGGQGRGGSNLQGIVGGSTSGNGVGVGGTPATALAGTTGQGSAGGIGYDGTTAATRAAGGSGGAGQAGSNASASNAGNGGNGLANSITGTSVTRAGGGGASASSQGSIANGTAGTGGATAGVKSATSSNATANTGSGSGGSSGAVGVPGTGNGGSGVVILRYPNTIPNMILGSGLTLRQDDDEDIDGSGNREPPTFTPSGFKVYVLISGTGNVSF
jgi:hypothetical protein